MDYVIDVGRRQRKRQAMHQTLLEVAGRLFDENGVTRTTVDDIAEAADVARTTVFNHFPNKESIALELASDTMQRIADRAQALLESGVPALDVLQNTARSILRSAISQGDVAVAVARELRHPDRERVIRADQLVPVKHIVEAILIQAREEDAVRSALPLQAVAEHCSASLVQLIAQVGTSQASNLEDQLSVCLDILFNGITDRSS